ncbi:MAG: DUF1295 domain-containing protein [Planctomycetota bacterium]|jgi:steroid 5-alpha reductase family enzyme
MLILWLIQLRTRDAGIVDFGWAASIGSLAILLAWNGSGSDLQRILGGCLGGIWGIRLALHILFDRVLRGEEDGRYQYLRAHWGKSADAHLLWFFQAQAVLAAGLAIPFFLIASHTSPGLEALQVVGLGICALGVIGESIADRQLARFRSDPQNKGKTCRLGMWRYSRHPNYFCEWLIWCGIALAAFPAPHGLWMLLLPVVMFLFLTRLTGIPYTEAQALRTRGDDYRAYQRSTSGFFPLPPSS